MLFKTYGAPQPTVTKLEDIDPADVMSVYERIKEYGSAARAWKGNKPEGTDYRMKVYAEIEQIVKDIITAVEIEMNSDNKPASKSELKQRLLDAGLKVKGLNLSTVLGDIMDYADGDPQTNVTWGNFSDMFVNPGE